MSQEKPTTTTPNWQILYDQLVLTVGDKIQDKQNKPPQEETSPTPPQDTNPS